MPPTGETGTPTGIPTVETGTPTDTLTGVVGTLQRRWTALATGGMRPFWMAVVVVLGMQLLGLLAYSTFLYHRFDLTDDFGTYSQAWWLIGHGHLNPVDTIQAPPYPFWQSHFELALWPLALLGRLWSSPLQLLWLQDLAIVATETVTLLWVARICENRILRRRSLAGGVALVALVWNPWWYQVASFDVHFEVLGLPFVVWSAYALWRGRPRVSLVAGAVALLFGDVVSVIVVGVAIAGRITPGSRPIRSSADAMAAPVLPADTMAIAAPSRTASAARTNEESFFRRTPWAGSSSMAITSAAGSTARPPVSPSASGLPTSSTEIPAFSTAWRAPATISPGAWSPPMASTATGSAASAAPVGRAPRATSRLRSPGGPCTTRSWDRPRAGAWPQCTAGTPNALASSAPSWMPSGCGSSTSRSSSWGRP